MVLPSPRRAVVALALLVVSVALSAQPHARALAASSVTEGAPRSAAAPAGGDAYSGARWRTRDMPVRYYIRTEGAPAGAVAAIRAAAQAWVDDAGSDVRLAYAGTTTRRPGSEDGVNVIGWGKVPEDSVGYNTIWFNRDTKVITEFDIAFNPSEAWSSWGEDGHYDVQSVATHEIGHALHLDDLYGGGDRESTMYGYSRRGDTGPRSLAAADLDGVRRIYPARHPNDRTAPSGRSDAVGWYAGPAAITLTASDGSSGAGVDAISYRLDGGPVKTVYAPRCVVRVSRLGRHTLWWSAKDLNGNRSVWRSRSFTVRAKPVLTLGIVSPPGTAGASRISGRMTPAKPAEGATVWLQRRTAGGWSRTGDRAIVAGGAFRFGREADPRAVYRVVFSGSDVVAPGSSRTLKRGALRALLAGSLGSSGGAAQGARGAMAQSSSRPLTPTVRLRTMGPWLPAGVVALFAALAAMVARRRRRRTA